MLKWGPDPSGLGPSQDSPSATREEAEKANKVKIKFLIALNKVKYGEGISDAVVHEVGPGVRAPWQPSTPAVSKGPDITTGQGHRRL